MNDGVCKFVPAWKTTFEPRCSGYDCEIPQVYEKMLKSFPNANEGAQAFLQFSRAPTESYPNAPKSYPWQETGETLSSFVQQMQGRGNYAFTITIDRNTNPQYVTLY